MSLSSHVHQLKLINTSPLTKDVKPVQKAAGQAMQGIITAVAPAAARALGQQVHLAGDREGHSVALALPARLCRQS